jgi:serine/threonine-protein kinase
MESDPDRLERFLNEVRTALRVTHPNVCRVYDIGEVDGRHYLSMEFVDGENLSSLLRRIGRLPGDKAVQIARQICAGLAVAHERGILHRDLKPANIMIDGRGKAKITDFGLAGFANSFAGDEVRAGTPLYMAPEQACGRDVSVRSDIYSLGLVLYELFTGHRAFEGTTTAQVLARCEGSTPTNPSHHVHDLDQGVERTILRCLEPEPAARPESALAVAASLPGGDPLAAALAAGETPSPDMVAAAGDSGGLRPAIGLPLFVFVVAGLFCIAAIRDHSDVEGMVPLPKPPEALVVEAREILELAGHGNTPTDSAHGFTYDDDYFDSVQAHAPSPSRWDSLPTVRPAPIHFWYRDSPEQLVASDLLTMGDWQFVSPSAPPWTVAGMSGVRLDPEGRLLRLEVVPPAFSAAGSASTAVDWSPLFDAAALDVASFTPTEPRRNPLITCDQRLAWEGTDPETGPIRIEACSFAGQPAYFEVIPRWRLESSGATQSASSFWNAVFFTILLTGVLGGGAVVARRNLRLGRGDRRGALRVASFLFFVSALAWVLQAHHVPTLAEIRLFFDFLGFGLMLAGCVWVVYIALEPYARRLWPNGLISWSRLLSGRFRDPLVGRDMLIGAAAGVFTPCWWGFYGLVVAWLGLPAEQPRMASLLSLSGVAETIGNYFQDIALAFYMPVAWLFLVLLLRVLLQRQWLAMSVAVLLVVGTSIPSFANPWLGSVFLAIAFGVFLFVLLRFGLLAAFFWTAYMYLSSFVVLTLNASAWYAGRSWFTILLFAGIAGFGFWTSLAGRPLVTSPAFE